MTKAQTARQERSNRCPSTMLAKKSIFMTTDGAAVRPTITEEFDLSGQIWNIEALFKEILSVDEPAFLVRTDKIRKVDYLAADRLGKKVLLALKYDYNKLQQHFPYCSFNPYVKVFFEKLKAANLQENLADLSTLRPKDNADKLNGFIHALREHVQADIFKKQMAEFCRLPNKNLKSLRDYFENLIDSSPQLLAIRIDLGYRKNTELPELQKAELSCDDVKKHLDALLKYLRYQLPGKPKAGYAWRLSHGLDKGWLLHLIVFLDATKVDHESSMGQVIGEAWRDAVTNGLGLFYLCAGHRSLCGTEPLKRNDREALKALDEVAVFLTKPEYYIRLNAPEIKRAFGKGVAKKSSHRARNLPLG